VSTRRVWLVRHAATDAPPGVAIGVTDLPLSPAGRAEADRLAGELALLPLTRIVSSDLRRARETADAIARPHGLGVEQAPGLREIDFGYWEGRSLAALWEEDPDAAAAWEADVRRTPPGFGESFPAFERRVIVCWRDLTSGRGSAETALVTHRGPLVVLWHLLAGVPLEEAWRIPFALGSATPVDVGQ
jgi:broad specificity phosphatase PhoE